MLAKNVMRKPLIGLSPDTTLRKAADLFAKRGISGAPVMTAEGRLLGMLSRTDLIGKELDSGLTVKQAMTPWVVTLEEDSSVRDAARQMLSKRIHRIVLTRDGEPTGIVTTLDMLRALLRGGG
ncbi:MAG: CBS domain-containing protein [Elusimicrobiota bacterium]|nr:MAG: CBS domain-containing protein [Elusimicrobiota bacterium]